MFKDWLILSLDWPILSLSLNLLFFNKKTQWWFKRCDSSHFFEIFSHWWNTFTQWKRDIWLVQGGRHSLVWCYSLKTTKDNGFLSNHKVMIWIKEIINLNQRLERKERGHDSSHVYLVIWVKRSCDSNHTLLWFDSNEEEWNPNFHKTSWFESHYVLFESYILIAFIQVL